MSATQKVWNDTIRALQLVHGFRKFRPAELGELIRSIEDVEKVYLNGDLQIPADIKLESNKPNAKDS